MATLKSIAFKANNGEKKVEIKSDVYVSKEGIFSTTLPEEMVDKLKEYGLQMSSNRNGRQGYFESKTLEGLTAQVEGFMKECFSRKLAEQKKVIRYQIATSCNYCINQQNGEILPNLTWLPKDAREDPESNLSRGWRQGTEQWSDDRPAKISFWFLIYDKKTWRYASGKETVQYTRITGTDKHETAEDWLLSVAKMGPTSNWENRTLYDGEVECNETNATVFVQLYKFICKANELITQLRDPARFIEIASSITKQLNEKN